MLKNRQGAHGFALVLLGMNLWFMSLVQVQASEPLVLTFAYEDRENYPAFVGNGSTVPEQPGTYVELLEEVTTRLGIELALTRVPWQRAVNSLANGSVDAINGSYKAEREVFAEYPRKPDGSIDIDRFITRDAYVLFVPFGSTLRWDHQKGLVGAGRQTPVIVAPYGYSITQTLRDRGITVEESDGGLASLTRMLLAGRAQGMIVHQRPMSFFLKDNPDLKEQLQQAETPVQQKRYYILLSQSFVARNPTVAQQFWDTLAQVRREQVDALYQKYDRLRSE